MGTDIFAFIEYAIRGTYRVWARPILPRNTEIFALLALGDGRAKDSVNYAPRGLPAGYSSTIAEAFFVDGDDAREIAEQDGIDIDIKEYPEWAQLEYVESGCFPNPDWHTPSWLSVGELADVMSSCGQNTGQVQPEYLAAMSAMRALAEGFGDEQVRLVFWFG